MRRPTVHPWVARVLGLALWVVIAILAVRAGLDLRAWTWPQTAPIRFEGDIANAVNVAARTQDPPAASPRADDPTRVDWPHLLRGYLARYDREFDRVTRGGQRDVRDNQYSFDYPPGRLLIVTIWTAPVFVER